MPALEAYCDAYPYAALPRGGGVLTIKLHTNGGDWAFNQNSQDTLARLMRDVATDRETPVVIVDGTGETFCTGLDMDEVGAFVSQFDAASADRWIVNGRALRLADHIKSGTVWLSTSHKYDLDVPVGGYRISGHGREQGAEPLENCSRYTTIRAN